MKGRDALNKVVEISQQVVSKESPNYMNNFLHAALGSAEFLLYNLNCISGNTAILAHLAISMAAGTYQQGYTETKKSIVSTYCFFKDGINSLKGNDKPHDMAESDEEYVTPRSPCN